MNTGAHTSNPAVWLLASGPWRTVICSEMFARFMSSSSDRSRKLPIEIQHALASMQVC